MDTSNTMARIIIIISLLFAIIPAFAQENTVEYELVYLSKKVNSPHHESAPIISPDGRTLYFFIANHPENNKGKDGTQDIWFCEKDSVGEWQKAQHMTAPLNRHNFNQVMSVSPDGNTLLIRGGEGKDADGFSLTHQVNGEWTAPRKLDIPGYEKMKNGIFSSGFMSGDGQVLLLYFSEKKESKYSDIYVSFLQESGKWTEPKYIKSNINTKYDEFGPFLASDDKTMYFASNRPGGKGSTDIYVARRQDDTWMNWSVPENLGAPVNTKGFDAYYSVDASGVNAFTTRAFMSADGGSLDVLGLRPKKEEKPVIFLSGRVLNKKSDMPLEADIEYNSEEGVSVVRSDMNDGEYRIGPLEPGVQILNAGAAGYLNLTDSVDIANVKADVEIRKDLLMTPLEVGTTVRLNKIFFDYNKITLREASFPELDKVVELLKLNPAIQIEIRGHTDSDGSDEYNLQLSQGRASQVREYLLGQWITSDRVIATGYGESMAEVSNDTEEGKQINRRVEFTVLKTE